MQLGVSAVGTSACEEGVEGAEEWRRGERHGDRSGHWECRC